VTVGRDPLALLVTRSGADKERLLAQDLVLVGAGGVALETTTAAPSAEAPLHAFLADSARAGAVLHTHTVWNTILGRRYAEQGGFVIRGYEMQKGIEGLRGHDDELFVPVVANAQDMDALQRRMGQALAAHGNLSGLLIAGHGLYAWGRTLSDALRHVEVFEFLFEVLGREHAWPS
jgi:methylthioribulose-1-phosphate dehydratase